MREKPKLAHRIIGKLAQALSKNDFGDWEAVINAYGMGKQTGEIRWSEYARLRSQYKGTTYANIRKIAPAVAATPLHLFIPESNDNGSRTIKRAPVSDEMKSYAFAQPHVKAMNIRKGVEEITSHAILDLLNGKNQRMTRSQIFERIVTDLELTGESYGRLIYDDNDVAPRAIVFLPAEKMKPKENDRGEPDGYEYRKSQTETVTIPEEEMLYIWYAGPFNSNRGFSPVAAMSQRITGETSIATIQNSTLLNMGIPPAIVKVMGRMPPEEFTEFKASFNDLFTSLSKRGTLGFTMGGSRDGKGSKGGWEIEKLGQTLEEMGYIEGAKLWREFISNGFGVPISKLSTESSNRATQDVANTEFLRDTILPKLTLISEELTESLIPLFGDLEGQDAFFVFANPVPEDTRLKITEQRVDRTTAVKTPNEVRKEKGMEAHPSPEADQLAPVRAPMPEQSESMAVNAIDRAVDKVIDDIKNGEG